MLCTIHPTNIKILQICYDTSDITNITNITNVKILQILQMLQIVKIVHFQELADIMMDPPPNCSAGPKVYNTLKYAVYCYTLYNV